MRVTFDSNVWEKVVLNNDGFEEVREKIYNSQIQAYICEIALSIESIKKRDRLQFIRNYSPKIEFRNIPSEPRRVCKEITIAPNVEAHPKLHLKLKECLKLAHDLNFKVLPMTNFATVRSPEIPAEMKVELKTREEFYAYAERLAICSKFIEDELCCGGYEYHSRKITIESAMEIDKKFAGVVAEWVDGECLASHYAYGNHIFCTLDRGCSSGSHSIFYPSNLQILQECFNLKIVSPVELIKFV